MDEKIQEDLAIITECVLQTVAANSIYLFGSHAYGVPNKESDIDICVVVPDEITDLTELNANILMCLRKKRQMNIDLLLSHFSVFNHRKNGPTIERTIAQIGTLLYGT